MLYIINIKFINENYYLDLPSEVATETLGLLHNNCNRI